MRIIQMSRSLLAVLLLAGSTLLALPLTADAHCDSLDGPVVTDARTALSEGDLTSVLKWLESEHVPEVRDAFQRTLDVRTLSDEARELADRWFFETVVRLHREGEGAPYTGLKSAGQEVDPGILAADRALETGSIDELAGRMTDRLAERLEEVFGAVRAAADFQPGDVEAGRRWVAAYVRYIHTIEEIHGVLSGGPGHAPGGAGTF